MSVMNVLSERMMTDKDDSEGYNEQTRELLDALIEETVE